MDATNRESLGEREALWGDEERELGDFEEEQEDRKLSFFEEDEEVSMSQMLSFLDVSMTPLASKDERTQMMQMLRLRLTGKFEELSDWSEIEDLIVLDEFVALGGIPIVQSYLGMNPEMNDDDGLVFEALMAIYCVLTSRMSAALARSNLHEDLISLFFGHRALRVVVLSALGIARMTDVLNKLLEKTEFSERLCQLIAHSNVPTYSRAQLGRVVHALCAPWPRPPEPLVEPFYGLLKSFFNNQNELKHSMTDSEEAWCGLSFPYIPVGKDTLLKEINVIVDEYSLVEMKESEEMRPGGSDLDLLAELLSSLSALTVGPAGVKRLIESTELLGAVACSLVHPRISERKSALWVIRRIAADHFTFLLHNEWAFKNLLIPTIAIKLTHFNHNSRFDDVLSFIDSNDAINGRGLWLTNENTFVSSRSFIPDTALTQFRHLVQAAKDLFSSKHTSSLVAAPGGGGRTDDVNPFVFEYESSRATYMAFRRFVAELWLYASIVGPSIPQTRVRGKKDRVECNNAGEGFGSKECIVYYLLYELEDAVLEQGLGHATSRPRRKEREPKGVTPVA